MKKTKTTRKSKPQLRVGILGYGEIGQAIATFYKHPFISDSNQELLRDLVNGGGFDVLADQNPKLDVLHICIPGNLPDFVEIARKNITEYCPQGLTIIHSTVPVGTTEEIEKACPTGTAIVHSPVRGVHPNLALGLKTFVKYIGSDHPTPGEVAANHLESIGMKPHLVYKSKTTELAKLLDTTYYGLCIAFHAYALELCEKEGLNFDRVMTDMNESYNAGYTKLGKANVVRPVLYPPTGPIGGHCVIPNAALLKKQYGKDHLLDAILRHK